MSGQREQGSFPGRASRGPRAYLCRVGRWAAQPACCSPCCPWLTSRSLFSSEKYLGVGHPQSILNVPLHQAPLLTPQWVSWEPAATGPLWDPSLERTRNPTFPLPAPVQADERPLGPALPLPRFCPSTLSLTRPCRPTYASGLHSWLSCSQEVPVPSQHGLHTYSTGAGAWVAPTDITGLMPRTCQRHLCGTLI